MADGYPMESKGISFAPSNVATVKSTLAAVGNAPAFTPIAGRPFNLAHKPSGDFAGSYRLEKKFAGDATWYVVFAYADLTGLPEAFALTEAEVGVTYRWAMTVRIAGDVVARLSA